MFRSVSTAGNLDLANEILFELKGGYCRELSHLAKSEIESEFPDLKCEIVSLEYHCLLVLDRKEGSNKNNIDDWGPNAVICDPWAKKVYRASEFWDVRYKSDDIEYLGKSKSTGQLAKIHNRKHYLDGIPTINDEDQNYTVNLPNLPKKL